jgi:uncharacterized protein (DUF305 family)
MKKGVFLSLITTVSLAVLGAACTTSATNNNSTNHNGMNHNSGMSSNAMNHNGMNHNAMSMNSNIPMDHSGMNHGGMDHSSMKSSANAANAPYDLQFLDTMIAHHQGAVDMAKMVDGRTERAELKAFANKIIADQNREIAQMKEWREKWYAGKPAAMNMEMPGMADSMKMDMSRLTAAKDKQFDVMFNEMMIPHHAGAITISKEALEKGEHAELKTLATNIIKEQEAEIKQMESWKSAWAK